MTPNTKATIIQTAAELFHSQGYHHTGINEILSASNVPKGSFYFHFKSKEELLISVIDYHVDAFVNTANPILQNPSSPPLERLRVFFTSRRDHYTGLGFRKGCPVGNIALELSDCSEPVRQKLSEAYDKVRIPIRDCISESILRGEIRGDADDLSLTIINLWEGTLMNMKVLKTADPIDRFIRTVFTDILRVNN